VVQKTFLNFGLNKFKSGNMKQLLQYLSTGETTIIEVPNPNLTKGHVLIRSNVSLISSGTERMLVDFGKANLLSKALQQPEKVKDVFHKIQADGFLDTYSAVTEKLAQPITLGYSNVGEVIGVGENVVGFNIGDRVVSNGPHAEVVSVPQNLCAKIPTGVTDEDAAFTVVAAIALQGIRLANPSLGESFCVFGNGLIGLLATQLLISNGCSVLAVDIDDTKLGVAKRLGAQVCNPKNGFDPVQLALEASNGVGLDGVLVTASTSSSDPINTAAEMVRKRGCIIQTGVTGIEIKRDLFYSKEIKFQVSSSYGPGRYDRRYENGEIDYPVGYVRWTAQRNFETILNFLDSDRMRTTDLVSSRFDFLQAKQAYTKIAEDPKTLGVLLRYPTGKIIDAKRIQIKSNRNSKVYSPTSVVLGVVGAGNFVSRKLLPAFQKTDAVFHTIVSKTGVSAAINGKKFDFEAVATDVDEIFDNEQINTVVVGTRHDTHSEFLIRALKAGKNAYIEKPMAITTQQIDEVQDALSNSNGKVMVGFNRRFSKLIKITKSLLDTQAEPKNIILTVNAGYLPSDHWHHSRSIGGGRLISEGCHFIDLIRYLVGHEISDCSVSTGETRKEREPLNDNFIVTLKFSDGSIGTVAYFANGAANYPKENLKIFCGGKTLELDNFSKLTGWGWSGFRKRNLIRQDKGLANCVADFVRSVSEGMESPIAFSELLETTKVTIQLADGLPSKDEV